MSLFCIRGCTRRDRHEADCEGDCPGCEPRTTEHGHLCRGCIDQLERWLKEIPDRYALLPQYLTPQAERDQSPESKHTKRPQAPTPVRLDVIDLLDTRLGRKWLGTEPTEDRRGTIGTLLAIANELRTKPRHDSNVFHEAGFLLESVHKLAELDHVADVYDELRILHRELGDAVGQHPPRPVGRCGVVKKTGEICGGNIYPTDTGGAKCRGCGADWTYENLRFLGTLIKQEPA